MNVPSGWQHPKGYQSGARDADHKRQPAVAARSSVPALAPWATLAAPAMPVRSSGPARVGCRNWFMQLVGTHGEAHRAGRVGAR